MTALSIEHEREVFDALAVVAPTGVWAIANRLNATSIMAWTDTRVRKTLSLLHAQGRVQQTRRRGHILWDTVDGGRP